MGLAQVESELGNDNKAEQLMQQGLALRGRPGTVGNTEYVEALNNYGGLLLQKPERLGDAEKLFLRALKVDQSPGRPRDNSVAIALAGLGELGYRQRRFKDAEGYFRKSLQLRRKIFGEPSVEVARTLNSLAAVLENLHKDGEAEDSYLHSIAMRKAVLGPIHPKLAPPLSNLARLYETSGQWNKVEGPYREAVAICQSGGNQDRNCGAYLSHLAAFLAEKNRCGEALRLAGGALSLLEARAGSKEAIAESHGVVGGCLAERKDFAKAEPLLLQALGELPEDPTPLVEGRIRKNLVRLYEVMGKPDQAAKYRTAAGPKSTS